MAKGLWTVLNVENVDKSLEFYKLLGLKTNTQTQEGVSWGNVVISDDAGLLIWDRHNTGPNQEQEDLRAWTSGDLGKGVLISIGVPNAQKVWERVSNMVTIDQPLREEPWGGRSFNVVDPDGYVIGLIDKAMPTSTPTRKVKRAIKKVKSVARTAARKVTGKPRSARKGR